MPLINPGAAAPQFTLPDEAGKLHSLKEFAGRPVVLYFYPKDDTPGCTIEACEFRDLLPQFAPSQAVVFGISPDDSKSHQDFRAKFNLNFTLLADAPQKAGHAPKVCELYGVWQEKSMYGKKYMGVARTTYLIDPDGKVAQRWDKMN